MAHSGVVDFDWGRDLDHLLAGRAWSAADGYLQD
jgi:hypothetical protein